YDAISARIAEDLGFEVGMFSGSVGSMAVLGAPDLVVLTLSEFAAQAYRICRAGNLALLVDADHGYGNALNVRRTVEELETAGICAMSIEDTVLPRPYGPSGKPTLSSIEESVGKMKAALSARQDKRLVIAGRTSALAIAGVDEAIKRARAYEAAGVDAVFLAGGVTAEAIEAVSEAIRIPIITGGAGGGPLGDLDWLGAHRVRVETFVTSFPDCELRVGMTATSFELPLNGTRVIDTPAGSDVCWRRIEPPFAQATAPGVPLMTPWNRAFTASGRIVDTRL